MHKKPDPPPPASCVRNLWCGKQRFLLYIISKSGPGVKPGGRKLLKKSRYLHAAAQDIERLSCVAVKKLLRIRLHKHQRVLMPADHT